jgi:hypothetical protein
VCVCACTAVYWRSEMVTGLLGVLLHYSRETAIMRVFFEDGVLGSAISLWLLFVDMDRTDMQQCV